MLLLCMPSDKSQQCPSHQIPSQTIPLLPQGFYCLLPYHMLSMGDNNLVHYSVGSKLVQDVCRVGLSLWQAWKTSFCHACKGAVTWILEYSQGMNSVTETRRRHWIVLRGKTELIKLQFLVYTKMQNLNFPLGFHMLSTYFTLAKSWFLYH